MRLEFEQRFSLPINGVEYTIGIGSREAFDGLAGDTGTMAEGVTDPHKALIIIAEDTPDHRRPAVFWHEFIHAAFGESGPKLYAAIVKCEEKDAEASQEQLCQFLGPILSSTLAGPDAIYALLQGPIVRKKARAPKAERKGRGQRATRP